jgi:WD40 repeat protein
MTLSGHKGNVFHVAFSPDGTRFLTAGTNATRVWNATTCSECVFLEGAVKHAAFSPDGRRIVTAGNDTGAPVWDAEDGRRLVTLRGHERGLCSVAFSPDGLRIVGASMDGTALVWGIHL